ncbi:MAG: Franean1_4349 family RiPP [Deinococcus sp.]|nr:Franean1_4349 family RiPP [Deinococcus sp.]
MRRQLNYVIGQALVNPTFGQSLLANPVEATQGLGLDTRALQALSNIRADSLDQFAGQLSRMLSTLS